MGTTMKPLPGRRIPDLERDYLEALSQAELWGLDETSRGRVEVYRRFVARNSHRLGPHPAALLEVALAEARDCLVRSDAEMHQETLLSHRPWFRRLHAPVCNHRPALLRTLGDHS